jgi:hypothetical protein
VVCNQIIHQQNGKYLKEGRRVRNSTFQEQIVRIYRLCNLPFELSAHECPKQTKLRYVTDWTYLPANDSNLLILASHLEMECNRVCHRGQVASSCFTERISVASSRSLSVTWWSFAFIQHDNIKLLVTHKSVFWQGQVKGTMISFFFPVVVNWSRVIGGKVSPLKCRWPR